MPSLAGSPLKRLFLLQEPENLPRQRLDADQLTPSATDQLATATDQLTATADQLTATADQLTATADNVTPQLQTAITGCKLAPAVKKLAQICVFSRFESVLHPMHALN